MPPFRTKEGASWADETSAEAADKLDLARQGELDAFLVIRGRLRAHYLFARTGESRDLEDIARQEGIVSETARVVPYIIEGNHIV